MRNRSLASHAGTIRITGVVLVADASLEDAKVRLIERARKEGRWARRRYSIRHL